MSANNTDMSKIKQVMRMMLQIDERGRRPSNRKIGETVGLYKGTVNDYVRRIEADSLSIEALLELDDPVLERRLCPGSAAYSDARFEHLSGKMEFYHQEMRRPHMTLQQLYEEYKETTANPYSYSQFCYHYSQHKKAAVAPRYPDFQITPRTVLLVEVLDCPLIVSGSVELGIICQTVLNGSSDYRIRLDEAVGFGYYHSVTAARLLLIGCTVVFNGTTHSHNLLTGEVRLHELVRFEYRAGVLVMVFPALTRPRS